MGLKDIMLREISQMVKDKYCMISLICGPSKTNKINEQAKSYESKYVRIENRAVVTTGVK